MMMHANDPVPDVRDLRPDTPDWLADLVHGLLAKDPEDRPAGAATVAAALAAQESLAGAATTVLPAAGARDDAAAGRRAAAGARRPSRCPYPRDDDRRGAADALAWVLGLVAVAALALLALERARRRRATRRPTPTSDTVGLDARADQRGAADDGDARRRPPRRPRRPPRRPSRRRRAPTPPMPWRRRCRRSPTRSTAVERDGLSTRTPPRRSTTSSGTSRRPCATTTRRRSSEETDKLVEEYDKAVQEGAIPAEAAARARPAPRRTSPTPSTPTRADVRNWAGNVDFSARAVEEPRSVAGAAGARRLAPARAGPRDGSLVLAGRRHDGHPRLHAGAAPRARGAPRASGSRRARRGDVCRGDGRAARPGVGPAQPRLAAAHQRRRGLLHRAPTGPATPTAASRPPWHRRRARPRRTASWCGSPHGDPQFPGAVLALGCLGVVTRLWLRIEPAYEVRQVVHTGVPHGGAARRHPTRSWALAYSVSLFTSFRDPSPRRRACGSSAGGQGDGPAPALLGVEPSTTAAAPGARHGPGRHDDPARHGAGRGTTGCRTSGPSSRRARGRSCSRSSSCPASTRPRRSRRVIALAPIASSVPCRSARCARSRRTTCG